MTSRFGLGVRRSASTPIICCLVGPMSTGITLQEIWPQVSFIALMHPSQPDPYALMTCHCHCYCGSARLPGVMMIHKVRLRAWIIVTAVRGTNSFPASHSNGASGSRFQYSRSCTKARIRRRGCCTCSHHISSAARERCRYRRNRMAKIQPSKLRYSILRLRLEYKLIIMIDRWGRYSRLLDPSRSSKVILLYRPRRGEGGR